MENANTQTIATIEQFENIIGREMKVFRSIDEMQNASRELNRKTLKKVAAQLDAPHSAAKILKLFDDVFGDIVDESVRKRTTFSCAFQLIVCELGLIESTKLFAGHDRAGKPIAA